MAAIDTASISSVAYTTNGAESVQEQTMANGVVVLAPVTLTSVNNYASGALPIVGALQQVVVDINITAITGNGAIAKLSRAGQDGVLYPLRLITIPAIGPYTMIAGAWYDTPFFDSIEFDIINGGSEVFSGTVSVTGRV